MSIIFNPNTFFFNMVIKYALMRNELSTFDLAKQISVHYYSMSIEFLCCWTGTGCTVGIGGDWIFFVIDEIHCIFIYSPFYSLLCIRRLPYKTTSPIWREIIFFLRRKAVPTLLRLNLLIKSFTQISHNSLKIFFFHMSEAIRNEIAKKICIPN